MGLGKDCAIALILRESLLLSKMIYSTEVRLNLTTNHCMKLEKIDEMYMIKQFDNLSTCPRERLYIISGTLPVRFIIRMRRLMYYWHILHRDRSELVFKVFKAQQLITDNQILYNK